jgi:hypothetical protein
MVCVVLVAMACWFLTKHQEEARGEGRYYIIITEYLRTVAKL